MTQKPRTCHLKGIAASAGVGIGKVWILENSKITVRPEKIDDSEVENHLAKFERAVGFLTEEYSELKNIAEADAAAIIEAQLLILNDPELHLSIHQKIEQENDSVVYAIFSSFNEYIKIIEASGSEWLNDRTIDVVSIRDQLIEAAEDKKRELDVSDGAVVFASEISPTVMVKLSQIKIEGIVMRRGGLTSHAVILCQSLGIPCIVGVEWRPLNINNGANVVLDGSSGEIVVWPDPVEVNSYRERERMHLMHVEQGMKIAVKPHKTKCGSEFSLRANVEFLEELPRIKAYGAKGVGLLRTETILFQKKEFNVEDQVEYYSSVVDASGEEAVTVRLFDAGGDKLLDEVEEDANPFLGWRGVRMLLDKSDLLRRQIEAIYRLSGLYPKRIKMLIPMISCIDEIDKVKHHCSIVREQLAESNIPFDAEMAIGIMVEVPSIALMAEMAAAKADFFSIGTNDLTQYTLAVDRGNEKISSLFEPLHPAIWKLIKMTKNGADKHGIPVSVCGEVASRPAAAACLLGMGIKDLSMTTNAILSVKSLLCNHTLDEMEQLSRRVNRAETPGEIHALFDAFQRE